MASEGSSNVGSGRCEVQSEDDEDEDTSSLDIFSMNQQNNENTDAVEVTLSNFRQLWKKEIKSPSLEENQTYSSELDAKNDLNTDPVTETEEEKAKKLFLQGVELERNGDMYEAIKFYKKSVQLIPDIEHRIYQSAKLKSKTNEESPKSDIPNSTVDKKEISSSDPVSDDHLANIRKNGLRNGIICYPENEQKDVHISSLPNELISYILRWVVSNDLDIISLERFATVCRGFYIFARDSEIWKLACIKTWGINCGTFGSFGYTSWRQMFIERERLQYNGCYISKTTYVRPGENSFQDQCYRPWHLIRYFRYLRFFPEGVVLLMTTPDDPIVCIDRLKQRHSRIQGVLTGHYRLNGDKVAIVITKSANNQNKLVQTTNSRFKNKRKENIQKDTFHLELQIRSHNPQTHCSLAWRNYTIIGHNITSGNVTTTNFEITKSKFPSFKFFQVNRYHAKSENPLQ